MFARNTLGSDVMIRRAGNRLLKVEGGQRYMETHTHRMQPPFCTVTTIAKQFQVRLVSV